MMLKKIYRKIYSETIGRLDRAKYAAKIGVNLVGGYPGCTFTAGSYGERSHGLSR